jgi:hypothetical protein
VLGLSGRDGGSDAELVASIVAVVDKGVTFNVGLEAGAAAIATMIRSTQSISWDVQGMLVSPPALARSQGLGGDTVVMLG